MNTGITWQSILAIVGAATGLSASLIWVIRDIRNFIRRPKLVILGEPNVGTWGSSWIFVTFEVYSENERIARECEAKARITDPQNGVSKKLFGLHWADVRYNITTNIGRVDIGAAPQRLDVAFTVPDQRGAQNGAFIAAPFALADLSTGGQAPQAALPAGEYVLEVTVSCENGSGDKKKIRLISPGNQQQLAAALIWRH